MPVVPQAAADRLRRCVVRLTDESGANGTGFFFTPSQLLTADHLLSPGAKTVDIPGRPQPAQVLLRSPSLDLAVLAAREENDDFVAFSADVHPGDQCFVWGHSRELPEGTSATVTSEGESIYEGRNLLKLKGGQLDPGLSGAPVLNGRTGRVCGVLVHSRHVSRPSGGYAVSVPECLTIEPIASAVSAHLEQSVGWRQLTSPIAEFDATDELFGLFPGDPISVEGIYVEPRYRVVTCAPGQDPLAADAGSTVLLDAANSVLARQRLLFLFGPYGSGKTLVTKYLAHRRYLAGEEPLLIACGQLLKGNRLDKLEAFVAESSVPLLLALDSLDEARWLRRGAEAEWRDFLERILSLLRKDSVSIIVNSRTLRVIQDVVYLELADLMRLYVDADPVGFLELQPFDSAKIREWLDAYANEKAQSAQRADASPGSPKVGAVAPYREQGESTGQRPETTGSEKRLYPEELKKHRRQLRDACTNPLFLYQVARCHYETGLEGIDDIYRIYRTFVDATARGKFAEEKRRSGTPFSGEVGDYRAFIRELACEVAARRAEELTRSELGSWYLDDNSSIYSISDAAARDVVAQTATDVLGSRTVDADSLAESVFRAHFLERTQGEKPATVHWRFRDNNILFFFLAEEAADALLKAPAHEPGQPLEHYFGSLLRRRAVVLHPLVLELLFSRLRAEPPEQTERLRSLLSDLVMDEALLGRRSPKSGEVGFWLETLLALTLLRLGNKGLDCSRPFFAKLLSLARELERRDPGSFDVFRAFFRDGIIDDATFSSTDLGGYNFSRTRLGNVLFKHCEFDKPLFDGVRADPGIFRMCTITALDSVHVAGRFVFDRSTLVSVRLREPGTVRLELRDSRIPKLLIQREKARKGGTVEIVMNQCAVGQLVLRNLRNVGLDLIDTAPESLKAEGSHLWVTQSGAGAGVLERIRTNAMSRIHEEGLPRR